MVTPVKEEKKRDEKLVWINERRRGTEKWNEEGSLDLKQLIRLSSR